MTSGSRFYTSSFTAWNRMRPDGLTAVRITQTKPRFLGHGEAREMLALPDLMAPYRRVRMLEQNLSVEQFVAGERARLQQVGAPRIAKQLNRLYREHGALILLGWSRLVGPDDICHRRVFADWFEEQTGETVPEYMGWVSPFLTVDESPQLTLAA